MSAICERHMRVIAGQFRSRPLLAPAGLDTRPTADRLRETLFNVLTNGQHNRIDGANFLDLYAGSGAVGIEAISRGAASVTFVEQAPPALAILQKNLQSLSLRPGSNLCVEKRNVARFLRAALAAPVTRTFDVVFLDPPYESAEEYILVLNLFARECDALLSSDALVVAEHRRKHALPETCGQLHRTRILPQGDAGLSFYRRTRVSGQN